MKTTLNVDDHVVAEVKCEAARQGRIAAEPAELLQRWSQH